jgi:hypothetical protein
MNTNLAQTSPPPGTYPAIRGSGLSRFLLPLLLATSSLCLGGPLPGPWVPLFKGIDHAVGTNNPSLPGNFPNEMQVVHCVRVDLTDPDIRLLTASKASAYAADYRETLSLSVPDFLKQHALQIAVDCNFYNASPGGADPTSEGVDCDVYGLLISGGTLVSAADNNRTASLLFTTNNRPIFDFINRAPGTNTAGIYTAVTGYYPLVSNGVAISDAVLDSSYPDGFIHETQPRTAYGVSQDYRYLYLMTIDGRQSGYSDGALDNETGYWMLQFGAWNAISMDGGGSTALYMSGSTGNPIAINHSSYLPAYGRERYIGAQFGVFAKPLPGFFNNFNILPSDTSATITFTTVDPATTQLEYGLTTNLTLLTIPNTLLATNHAVLLTNLTPGTEYFFAAVSKIGANQYVSSNYNFFTTNYVTTNLLCDFSTSWTFTVANLDGTAWTAPGYDDSAWQGPSPGLFWTDTYGFPDPDIPEPVNTEIALDPDYGTPYSTYYFRTHFTSTNSPGNFPLLFQDYLADGAVFYLNGAELYRVRMPTGPILNATPATAHPCAGDATCPDNFIITSPLATNLLSGDNVLAVEVHTMAIAHAATFGMSLAVTNPFAASPPLTLVASNATAALSWNAGGFFLQQAGTPIGPWTNVPGPVITSPFTTPMTNAARFYRLAK